MATYSVIALDGQRYGPADEATLAQWAREGRLDARTALQNNETGETVAPQALPAVT